MNNQLQALQAVNAIRAHYHGEPPKIALITGSGLGALAETITKPFIISYNDIPGFSTCSVSGHGGQLYLGYLNGIPVACMQGRVHYYEGTRNETIQLMIHSLRALGCNAMIATNAAGSLRANVGPGKLVMLSDHINMQFQSPLVGPNIDEFGPRFVGMENAYDANMREQFLKLGQSLGIDIYEGVYIGVLGPAFETPAEIKAYKTLGADLVGMSTVAETIVARHCGMKVAVISTITNLASGMHDKPLSHEETLAGAALGVKSSVELIRAYIKQHGEQFL